MPETIEIRSSSINLVSLGLLLLSLTVFCGSCLRMPYPYARVVGLICVCFFLLVGAAGGYYLYRNRTLLEIGRGGFFAMGIYVPWEEIADIWTSEKAGGLLQRQIAVRLENAERFAGTIPFWRVLLLKLNNRLYGSELYIDVTLAGERTEDIGRWMREKWLSRLESQS